MPTKRRTAAKSDGNGGSSSRSVANPQSDDDNYKLKRQRNNDAVKKTRQKSKNAAQERKNNIEKLTKANAQLETEIEITKEHITYLKNLLMGQKPTEDQKSYINEFLQSSDRDD